ncbi:MAG: PfkB family carbohydrate kinase, partial [Acidobacteriaceae bacterium]
MGADSVQVLSIGEILWDVFPREELLGGAALNFAVNVTRLGNSAALMTAVGNDARGSAALRSMQALGLRTDLVQITDELPTGVAVVRTGSDGEPQFDIPRPAAFDRLELSPETLDAATRLQPDWLYFGTLLQTTQRVEEATRRMKDSLPGVRCFYDMNLRDGHWNFPLVERLCAMASLLKLNEAEAKTLDRWDGVAPENFSLQAFCQRWRSSYHLDAICVTLGGDGCYVNDEGSTHLASGFPTAIEDTVGAGDAFAAAFLHGYHRDWPLERTARFANA